MCRMLGFISREPIPISRYLQEVSQSLHWLSFHGQKAPHRDGLGLAYKDTDNQEMKLYRWGRVELTQYGEITDLPNFPTGVRTTLLIAHARKASKAYEHLATSAQAHPLFKDDIYLAHNGTIHDVDKLNTQGDTDTQRLLHWLACHWKPRTPSKLQETLKRLLGLVKKYTALNLLITEGSHLYAFCCYSDNPEYYTLHYRLDLEGGLAIVASEPLDSGSWQLLANWEFLKISPKLEFERGRVIV